MTILRNRYRILSRVGSGGGGSVYAVEDLYLGRSGPTQLALKALFPEAEDPQLVEGLRQEFRVLATLSHPLLARVHDFGRIPAGSGLSERNDAEGYFLTRDLIDGEDLASYGRTRAIGAVCRAFQRGAQLLDLLHCAGMLHGDFKPANVIVDGAARVHLIDFGLSGIEGRRTSSGTAAYLAPEMLRGAPVDRRADLYALGISLYQVLTGELPLPTARLAEIMSWHLAGEPLRLAEKRPDAPPQLQEVLERLTARDPEDRYPSAAEAAGALANICRILGDEPYGPLGVFVPRIAPGSLVGHLSALEAFALRRRHADALEGPAVAAVVGEPGGGKTTILRELAWRRQLDGVEVFQAEFRDADRRAHGSWRDILDQVAGLTGKPHPLDSDNPHVALFQRGATSAEDGTARRYARLQQIAAYLGEVARAQPLLILLDNLEQADEESLDALRFFGHTLRDQPLAIICAVDAEAAAAISGAARARQTSCPLDGALRIELEGLPAEAIGVMLRASCGRQEDELAARIREHTGGNPLFVQEVLRDLEALGWPAAYDPRQLSPPSELQAMYARRRAELGSGERRVIETLALLGRPARLELLTRAGVEPGAEGDLQAILHQLEEAGWLARSAGASWGFRQARAAGIIARAIEAPRARELHRAIVVALDSQPERDVVERTRHALGAEDIELAASTLFAAISQLSALGAYGRAAELVQAALDLIVAQPGSPLEGKIEALRGELGQLYWLAGDYSRAEQQLTQVSRAAGAEGVRAQLGLARVLRSSGRARQALGLLEPLVGADQPHALRAEASLAIAESYAELDEHERVLEATAAGLALAAETSGGSFAATLAALRAQRAWSLGHLQRYEEAQREFELASRDMGTTDHGRAAVDILNRWAVISWRQGRYEQVEKRYLEALAIAQRIGDIDRAAVVRFNLAAYHLQRGELAAALRHLPESLQLFEAMGARQKAASARCNLGQLQLEIGLYEQARATLQAAREQMAQLGRRSGQALAELLLALVSARRRHHDEARRGIAEARALYRSVGQRRDAADALLDLAEVELDAGAGGAALEVLDQAAREPDLADLPDLQVRAIALRARALATRPETTADERAAVARELDEALQLAERLGSPQALWPCHYAAMVLARANRDVRAAAIAGQRAREILQRMGDGLPFELQSAFWADPRRQQIRRESDALAGNMTTNFDLAGLDKTLPARLDPRHLAVEERFYRLLEIYRQINAELDAERLLGTVMDTAVELTGAERGFLLLARAEGDLNVEIARNLDPSKVGSAYSRSIAEHVMKTGQPIVTVSAYQDPRFSTYASVHQQQLESVLCIPIQASRGVVGVLYMESRFRSGRFQPEDQRLLMAFGDQVAIALTNAQLYKQVREQAEKLERANAEIEALAEERAARLAERTAELEQAERDLAKARRQLRSESGRFGLVGLSTPMMRVYELIERVAPTDLPVLVEGESGTGKEMVARAIHEQSPRRRKHLVSVNCAAIPESLLESELFGHVRGAFTGANRDRQGLFALADGGTLFLDEIGDMPMRMQVDLLRALQEQVIRPVGAQKDIKVDVRVVAASNKSLAELVRAGAFREDLFYRLHVIQLVVPPLRARSDDIPLLVDHFLGRIAGQVGGPKRRLTHAALALLAAHPWPGNVRQLEHALMNAAVLTSGEVLEATDFKIEAPVFFGSEAPPTAPAVGAASGAPTDTSGDERARIVAALEQCGWNRTQAAKQLKMPRRTFYRRLKSYGIE